MSKRKKYDEKWFEIAEGLTVHCWTEDTNYGFRHLATIHATGQSAKVCYSNRTWEAWTYQTVLRTLGEKLDDLSIIAFAKDDHYDNSGFNAIAMVAKLGDILTSTPAESNDWKKRMLSAGLGDGLTFPDDWDTLSEDEKAKRLDGAIGTISGGL